jgi:hypothetical protein
MKLETNVAAVQSPRSSYPSELSALSEGTPISAHPLSAQASAPFTAPIVPPSAYTDFLKAMLGSPTIAAPRHVFSATTPTQPSISRTQSGSTTATSTPTSPPSTASSAMTDVSCKCDHKRAYPEEEDEEDEDEDMTESESEVEEASCRRVKREDRTTPVADDNGVMAAPATPFTPQPRSAPVRPTSFPSLKIPLSPSFSVGGCDSPMGSPYSATFSATSPSFPYSIELAKIKTKWDTTSRTNSKTVRYRSVVTRTITYAPRISPVPKSKRRRVE